MHTITRLLTLRFRVSLLIMTVLITVTLPSNLSSVSRIIADTPPTPQVIDASLYMDERWQSRAGVAVTVQFCKPS